MWAKVVRSAAPGLARELSVENPSISAPACTPGMRAAPRACVHTLRVERSAPRYSSAHERAELGRLALLLAAVGVSLALVTVHGSMRAGAADAPFPTITRAAR